MAGSVSSGSRSVECPSPLSYSEVADPLSKMDDYVTKIIEKATSKQERKKSHRKIKDLVDHMKPQWNRMMDAVARYEI